MGDKSDNIFPIHKKLGIKTAEKYISNEELLKTKLENEEINKNYNLNVKLIDMDFIPKNLQINIIDKFKNLNL